MKVYLDNAATTEITRDVREEINKTIINSYGNPSSLHDLGINSQKRITFTRNKVSEYLKVKREEVFFTSGATESNNLAIKGYAIKNINLGKHIITTKIEHNSVLESFKYLESIGFNVTYLNVNKEGLIDLDELLNLITDNTILISIMHVNNEIGTINNIEKIAKSIKKNNNRVAIHIDGVQGFTKYKIDLRNIDLYSFSGHKIHGLKGNGGLVVKNNVNITPLFHGGQQEKKIRPGTENLIGIVALGKTLENMEKQNYNNIKKLKYKMVDYLEKNIEGCYINSKGENFSDYILSVSFDNMLAEVLLHDLESKGVYVSTGSACNSKNKKYSHVLNAIGISEKLKSGTIRISFSYLNTEKEIEYSSKVIEESVNYIRKFMKGVK